VAYTASSSYGATNYKWTGPSGAVIASGQGTTASTIHFGSSAGNVTCVAKNSCGSKGTAFFPVSMTCRSMESILPFDANISPNPAFGKTYLTIVKGANKTASVTIVDAIGKTRLQQEIELGLGNEVELDLSSLAAGIYLVEVRADDHNKILRLVVE
jgi:hypothetical protein